MQKLIIGNKNYSSWSLRPWLLLKYFNIPFSEIRIPLYAENSKSAILEYSASGFVPALEVGELSIWDSMSIIEYTADEHPELPIWPQDKSARVLARNISNEMHSGFFAIRNTLPMNCRTNMVYGDITPELQKDIDRIKAIWTQCRALYESKGPFLFGEFTAADAMFAPVVLRFNSYGIAVGEVEAAYMDSVLSVPALQQWIKEGVAETETMPDNDLG